MATPIICDRCGMTVKQETASRLYIAPWVAPNTQCFTPSPEQKEKALASELCEPCAASVLMFAKADPGRVP